MNKTNMCESQKRLIGFTCKSKSNHHWVLQNFGWDSSKVNQMLRMSKSEISVCNTILLIYWAFYWFIEELQQYNKNRLQLWLFERSKNVNERWIYCIYHWKLTLPFILSEIVHFSFFIANKHTCSLCMHMRWVFFSG